MNAGLARVGGQALSEQEKPPEAEIAPLVDLTLVCRFPHCGRSVWSINASRMASAAHHSGKPIVYTDLIPLYIGKRGLWRKPTFIPLDCPFCGDQMFMQGYHGGFFVKTLEKGEYPGSYATRSGIRLQPSGTGWFDVGDQLLRGRLDACGVSADS